VIQVKVAIVISTISLVKDGVARSQSVEKKKKKKLQLHGIAGLGSAFVESKDSLQELRQPCTCCMKSATD
jgi:hypothetical protein